jgi:serine protease
MKSSTFRRVALSTLLLAGACADVDDPVAQPRPTAPQSGAPQRLDFDGRYVVTYKAQTGRAAAGAFVGGNVEMELPARNAVAVRLTDAQVNQLRGRADIESVEQDVRRYPQAETVPYGVTMIGTGGVPATPAAGDPLVTVCIIDSGVSAGHEDFAGVPISGNDLPGSGAWNEDLCGHGTHVAGTIAAAAGNGIGVVGVAPGAVQLKIVKVFAGADCGWAYSSSLVAALDECRAGSGTDIVSMSLGGGAKSRFEENAFKAAADAGVLAIAAAGNDGNNRMSYPASYASVVSVAAIDSNKVVADFSQHNSQVDIAAPGVGVTSTYVFEASLNGYNGSSIEFAALGSASGTLVDGGLCDSVGSWSGAIVLCQRGTISFYDKVHNAQLGGAAGVAIYNNVAGGFAGTLGDGNTSTIPAISLSDADGAALLGSVGQAGTLVSDYGDGYADLDGTSMATPHVSAAAALLWAQFPDANAATIRSALIGTAEDLGTAGRDDFYGAGLVRVDNAYNYLANAPVCKPAGDSCTANAECCSNNCPVPKGVKPRVCK